MNLYGLIWRNMGWTIFVALLTGRLFRLERAINYLKVRQNKELYRLQLRRWELERRLDAIQSKLEAKP